ncbi:uncharacterized protein PAC_06114 [Phialocephala subalpina]|uniref:Uncharacterized protein n=1 Tax=Phialocephala subalpina TaxID=576137 RepID=A0A1L7WTY3_9HELO|nr:uncharacterized protein PAC_06114 [Phialocephala subalpina]
MPKYITRDSKKKGTKAKKETRDAKPDRTNIITCKLDTGAVEMNLLDVERVTHMYPLQTGLSGYPKEFVQKEEKGPRIAFTARNCSRQAVFGTGKATSTSSKYLEVPILHNAKKGVHRYPVEKKRKIKGEQGPYRAILTYPAKELAGVVYHPHELGPEPFKKNDARLKLKKAHREKRMSP